MEAVYVVAISATAVVVLVIVILYRGRLTRLELTRGKWVARLTAKADPDPEDHGHADHHPGRVRILRSRIKNTIFRGSRAPDVWVDRSRVEGLEWDIGKTKAQDEDG